MNDDILAVDIRIVEVVGLLQVESVAAGNRPGVAILGRYIFGRVRQTVEEDSTGHLYSFEDY